MSSLSDIQQMHNMLQEMDRMLSRINTGLNDAELNAQKAQAQFRQLESVALRYLVIAQRIGLPPDVNTAIQLISRMIIAVRQLEQTMILAQAALAGAGPIGWAVLGASAAYTALSFYSIGG